MSAVEIPRFPVSSRGWQSIEGVPPRIPALFLTSLVQCLGIFTHPEGLNYDFLRVRAGTSLIQEGRLETNDIWSKEYLLQNCLTHHMTACGTGSTSIISDLNDDNLGSNLVTFSSRFCTRFWMMMQEECSSRRPGKLNVRREELLEYKCP